MANLIDKDALVAEIEKRKIPFKRDIEDGYYPTYLCALMDFEDLLDTLEVKEVDLKKEISFQWSKFCLNGKDKDYFVNVAKHFFELGMAVSNKAQKGE